MAARQIAPESRRRGEPGVEHLELDPVIKQLLARVHALEDEVERLAARLTELEAAEGGPERSR